MGGKTDYWFWLNQLPKIGNTKLRRLLSFYDDDPRELYYASEESLETVGFLNRTEIEDILSPRLKLYARELAAEYEAEGVHYVTPQDEVYPARLRTIYDKPFILYYRGTLPCAERKAVAIVGSRRCSEYGRSVAYELARQLALHDVDIISGLAMGIDAQAHTGALRAHGITHGVLANDAMTCYPQQNFNLYMDMIEAGGGALSENPPGTPAYPGLFPLRNRIISGLCDAVIVVEAGHKSGSLITANLALDQGRDIYAVPGRLGDPVSLGCNELIGEGATMISSVEQLLYDLKILEDHSLAPLGTTGRTALSRQDPGKLRLAPTQNMLYSLLLDFGPKSLETLIHDSKLPVSEVLQGIVGLEIAGLVREVSKNIYVRVI